MFLNQEVESFGPKMKLVTVLQAATGAGTLVMDLNGLGFGFVGLWILSRAPPPQLEVAAVENVSLF